MIQKLPTGYAREAYWLYRKRGKSVLEALLAASVVDACPDDYACAKCGAALDVRKHVRIRAGRAWCAECALTPTGHEQEHQR